MGIATATALTGLAGAASQRSSARRAARSQERGQAAALEAAERGAREAREAAIPLFSDAQQNALRGFEAALGLQGQIAPEQISALQQGNQAAQQTLLAGLPQFQNALLGNNIDLSGLQQQAPQIDTSLFNQQLPQFTSINQSLQGPQPQQPTTGPNPFFNFLPPTTGIPNVGAQMPLSITQGMDVGPTPTDFFAGNLSRFLGGKV